LGLNWHGEAAWIILELQVYPAREGGKRNSFVLERLGELHHISEPVAHPKISIAPGLLQNSLSQDCAVLKEFLVELFNPGVKM